MTRLPARPAHRLLPAAALVLAAPLGAAPPPGGFSLPDPNAAPAPAGEPNGSPPAPAPGPAATAPRDSAPPARTNAPAPAEARTLPQSAPAPAATGAAADLATPETSTRPIPTAPPLPAAQAQAPIEPVADAPNAARGASILPDGWLLALSALAAIAVLAGLALWQQRQRRKPLRLAAPAPASAPAGTVPPAGADLPRLDLMLDITSATRSVMMFTLDYRLTIANRTDRAVNDLNVALQLACARAIAGAGSAQALEQLKRIGPHQALSVSGTLHLPLSAITPLRQGTTPLFVPLVHVTIEGEGQRALASSFVIGPPSASGRVHPISLDQPPGGIAGLTAQAIAVPAVSAAA